MVKLGFSLYPEYFSGKEIYAYVDQFQDELVERVFMSFLQLNPQDKSMLLRYQDIISYCNERGLQVFADVNPALLTALGWEEHVTQRAAEFGLSGIRLDEWDGEDSQLKQLIENLDGVQIEVNMSTRTELVNQVFSAEIDCSLLTACHNFYPRKYTGLSASHYHHMNQPFVEHGVPGAAFISAQSANKGPWIYDDALVTLEEHRYLSSLEQLRWFLEEGTMEYLIISNQPIRLQEWQSLLDYVKNYPKTNEIVLRVEGVSSISQVEKEVIAFQHTYRPDVSADMIRSSMPRLVYGNEKNPCRAIAEKTDFGTVVIGNDAYPRYCGELAILLHELELPETYNVVGKIVEEDRYLISTLKPGQLFQLKMERGVDG